MTKCRWRVGVVSLRVMAIVAGCSGAVRARGDIPALIQIGVEVVEVDEKKTQKLGIQWMDTLHVFETEVPSLLKIGTLTRSRVMADLQALLEEGAADLLANPKLVTRDGTTASFHAGGEVPYAVAGGLGTSTVEFKPYGVKLKISPRLEEGGRIALAVDAEVSGLDEQNSVTLAGNIVPGIRTRQVSSELTMSPGNTLTMAGLIQSLKQSKTVGVPGLMHIPLVGAFFRHKTQTLQRTSIVVFITPTLLDWGDELLDTLDQPDTLGEIHG